MLNIKNLFLIILVFYFSAEKLYALSEKKCIKEGPFINGYCVNVDNHLLYAESYGLPIKKGRPTVIFLPGSGEALTTWNKVTPHVARFAHVFTYNRSGYEPSQQYKIPKALTAPLVVNELISLLNKLHIPPPYILVAHSHGGLFAQYLSLKYPEIVDGIVFVDSSTSKMILKWFYFHESMESPGNPHYYELKGTRLVAEAVKYYLDNKSSHPLGNIPIIVLTADNHIKNKFTPQMEKDWQIYQNDLAHQSKQSSHIIVYHTGHDIHFYDPQLVVNSIYTMTLSTLKKKDKDS